MFFGYIKDCNDISNKPKSFVRVSANGTSTIREDLLTSAKSSFSVMDIPSNINNGDIFTVYDSKGVKWYTGKIISFGNNNITCTQLQSLLSGNWLFKNAIPTEFDNKWYFERYSKVSATYPVPSSFSGMTPVATTTYNDNSISTSLNITDNYSAKCATYLYASKSFTTSITFTTDDNGSVTLNDVLVSNLGSGSATSVSCTFKKGWNKLVVCYTEDSGGDGWVTSPRLANVSGIVGINSTLDITGNYIENELKTETEKLISGKVGDYTDSLIYNKYKDFSITCSELVSGFLPTFDNNKVMDFESFIYQMYEDYGIIYAIDIPYEGDCSIRIFKPNYDSLLISDNSQNILSITPTQKLEQYNKLVIFSKGSTSEQSTYRATYVVSDELIPRIVHLDEEEPLVRFVETNTKIVFSDDELDTIVASNLSANMYNHKVEFDLLLDNKIYNWKDFRLGQELEIWNGTNYYKTIYTGYEMQLPFHAEPTSVKITCGKVRVKLTDKLLRKGI